MNAQEVVRRFAETTAMCIDQIRVDFVALDRQTLFVGAVLVPRDGTSPLRSGRLGSLGAFRVHGRGCRFELDSGEIADVDWDDDGNAVFDSWRLLVFARSLGEEATSRDSLRIAAAQDPTLRQLALDTFTWVQERYNIERDRVGF